MKKDSKGMKMELQDKMKHNNMCITGIPEGEEKEQGIENLLEKVMTENFPNLVVSKVTQVQEMQRVSIMRNPKKPTPRHITIKVSKFKDKEIILNAEKEKHTRELQYGYQLTPQQKRYKPEGNDTKYSK